MTFKFKCNLPSKKVLYVSELTNGTYTSLLKYITNQDTFGFYQALDDHIRIDVPYIDTLTLLDKVYIYIALFANSVKATFESQPESIFDYGRTVEYSLDDTLAELNSVIINENIYTFEFNDKPVKVVYSLPTRLETIDEEITFEPFSAIRSISYDNKDYKLETKDDYAVLSIIFSGDNYYKFIEKIIDNYSMEVPIIKNKISYKLLNSFLYKFLMYGLYDTGLKNQLDLFYTFVREFHMTLETFNNLSPADTNVLLYKLVAEREAERKENEKNQQNAEFL